MFSKKSMKLGSSLNPFCVGDAKDMLLLKGNVSRERPPTATPLFIFALNSCSILLIKNAPSNIIKQKLLNYLFIIR